MPEPTRPPRRPAHLDEALAETIIGAPDPAETAELAHSTAHALVDGGRGRADDPALVRRLVTLVEDEGIETIAELWSASPAETLPGALWRLYLVREWASRNPHQVVRAYRAGLHAAEVAGAIAGVVVPPSPEDVMDTADRILSGVFDGDLDVALDRASAFLRVAATGLALSADDAPSPHASSLTSRSASLMRTSLELERSARLARSGSLE
ncbi:MAG: hypothetical protein Q4G64_03460 [bacterium]|nr:hypothetical protein [bacterium]